MIGRTYYQIEIKTKSASEQKPNLSRNQI